MFSVKIFKISSNILRDKNLIKAKDLLKSVSVANKINNVHGFNNYSKHSLMPTISSYNLHYLTPVKRNYCDKKDSTEKPSAGQKLKKAVTEYGSTVIVFHVTISLISLGTSYLLVSSGLDVSKLVASFGINTTSMVSNAGTFAVAYAFHKLLAPVRISITLTSAPLIVKYLRNKGILKKPA